MVVSMSSAYDNLIWEFPEPHPTGGQSVVAISGREMIKNVTEIYRSKGLKIPENPETMILDFCAVHWAYPAPEGRYELLDTGVIRFKK